MVRPPPLSCGEGCRREEGTMKKGAWTAEEDEKLVAFIEKNRGHGSWRTLPKLAGLERCGKSCRLRWTNYLRPNIKRGNFSADEESLIVQLHAVLGNKWSAIASHLPGRTDNEVKNHWNTHLRKKLTKMGIDPATHLPFNLFTAQRYLHSSSPSTCAGSAEWQKALLQHSLQVNSTIACHLVQWELARLEAEARQQLTSSQGMCITNSCASWLQNLHQNQVTGGYESNALLAAANVQTQPENGQSLSNAFSATQIHSLTNHLARTSPLPCQGNNGGSINSDTLQNYGCSPLIKEELEHLQEDCVLTCASGGSTVVIGTPSSSDSLSSHLLPIELEVSDDLRSLARFSDESSIAVNNIDPHDSSPVSLDQPAGPQDSYWNRILNFLDQVDLDNL